MTTARIGQYHSIFVEWNIENIGNESHIFFDRDRARLFTYFSSYLKNSVHVFIDQHSNDFSVAENGDLCEEYSELGLSPETWKFDDPLKILNHILDEGKQTFIATEDVESLFSELDSFLNWVSNVPSYPNRDFVQIPIMGEYPGFIEQWYRYETRAPMLPLQNIIKIEDSIFKDQDAAIIGWLCILVNSDKWYEKPDAMAFVSKLVDRFNQRHAFT